MKRSGSLPRKTAMPKMSAKIRPKRSKPRRGQPTAAETKSVREHIYERSGGRCELRKSEDCITGVLPWDGPNPWSHGHLVHLRNKRMWGTTPENCVWGCWHCHLVSLHNPKSVPSKAAL